MCEVEKWLRFVTLDGSRIRDGEMLIIQGKDWSRLKVSTT